MKLIPWASTYDIEIMLKKDGFYDKYPRARPFEILFFGYEWWRHHLYYLSLSEEWISPDEEDEEGVQRNIIRSILRPHFKGYGTIIVAI